MVSHTTWQWHGSSGRMRQSGQSGWTGAVIPPTRWGEVILHTITTREAMWELPTLEIRKVPNKGDKGGGKGRKGDSVETTSKARPERPPAALKRADALENGTHLCRYYNSGT